MHPVAEAEMRNVLYQLFDRVMRSAAGVWTVRRTWCSDDERWRITKSAPGAGDAVATANRKAAALSIGADVKKLLPNAVLHGGVGAFHREWPVQSFAELSFHLPGETE